RYGDRLGELERRLEAEPGVADVAFVHRVPGVELPADVEVEGARRPLNSTRGHSVRVSMVDVGFFDAFDVTVHSGREFRYSDLGAGATAVIVNDAFVDEILGGANAIGRSLRYTYVHPRETGISAPEGEEPTRWYEIVGVVSDDLTVGVDPGESAVRVYHPMALGEIQPTSVIIRMAGRAPAAFAPRLRQIAASVDPTLQVTDMLTFDEALRQMQNFFRLVASAIALVTLSVLLLSAAGVHALMSFTVARRRKEIGIRAALGAHPRRLLASIFAHAIGQLTLGLAIGIGVAVLVNDFVDDLTGGYQSVAIPAAAALMLVVGLLAALGPARRGLRIQPTEALKEQ
ncbi:MAG: FtsX-like permease family protein, partial [Longimicrobiales bacterium]